MKSPSKVKRVCDYYKLPRVLEALVSRNTVHDGPCAVHYVLNPGEYMPVLEATDCDPGAIVLPGDGAEFPARSFAIAMLKTEVWVVEK